MDDPRTRESLDALADLFLTGVADPEPDTAAPGRGEPPEQPADADVPSRGRADSPLDGPEPLRMRPKLGPTRAPEPDAADDPPDTDTEPGLAPGFPRLHRGDAAATRDADASPLAAIAPGDDPADAPNPAPADLVVEGVLLGNLPGVSGPWLTQYAQLLAQHDGPVAVLHLDAGSADLELVEPADAPDRDVPRAVRRPRAPHSAQTLDRVLRELTRDPEAPVRTLLVHAPAEPASAARLAALELWTLVCGADDAAVVAGYRLLKSLITAAPASAAKQIGLMVMGSDEPTSRRAADKFASASASFLHVPVQLVGWQQRMLPVNVRQLGRFDLDDAQCDRLLARLTEPLAGDDQDDAPTGFEPGRPASAPAGATIAPPRADTPDDAQDDDEPVGLAPEPPDAPEPVRARGRVRPQPAALDPGAAADDEPPFYDLREPTEPAPDSARPPRAEPRPGPRPEARRQPRPERRPEPQPASARPEPGSADPHAGAPAEPGPRPTPDAARAAEPGPAPTSREPSDAAPDATPDLAALLAEADPDFAGAVALQARCPHHRGVQLALDQSGRVHLLIHHDGDAADGLHAALVELLQARAWAHEHRELLALTQRQLRFDPGLTPALHLFTASARLGAGLSARLPGDLLRLHLLQGVELDGDTAWLATPLS